MNEHKKLIVLDLDETLIHATSEPPNNNWDFEIGPYKVFRRPFLKKFLEGLLPHFKVAVWSSASDDYVVEVVENIFPEDYPLEFVWGRSRCTLQYEKYSEFDYATLDTSHLNYVKILKKVKKLKIAPIEHILIVDDTPRKSRYNYGNAIYPKEFNGELEDNELELLLPYLISLKEVEDVRKIEKRSWRDGMIEQEFD